MKILHYLPDIPQDSYPLGSPGRFSDLLEALEKDDHNNLVALPRHHPVLQARLERLGIPYILKKNGILSRFFSKSSLKSRVLKFAPDVILRFDGDETSDLKALERYYQGPIRNLRSFYNPVLAPDPAIRKLERADSLTPEKALLTGCFMPGAGALEDIEKLLSLANEMEEHYIWLALSPPMSPTFQDLIKKTGMIDKTRFFDATIPRSAFYKALDIAFVSDDGLEADMSFTEATCLGLPVISCKKSHRKYDPDQKLFIFDEPELDELLQVFQSLSKDPAKRVQMGERARQVYKTTLHPDKTLPELLEYL